MADTAIHKFLDQAHSRSCGLASVLLHKWGSSADGVCSLVMELSMYNISSCSDFINSPVDWDWVLRIPQGLGQYHWF